MFICTLFSNFLTFFRSCGKKDKKKTKEKVAVKSVSFTVPKGQVFGLLGKEKIFSNESRVNKDFENEFNKFCWFLR